jgi:hypothetical protein
MNKEENGKEYKRKRNDEGKVESKRAKYIHTGAGGRTKIKGSNYQHYAKAANDIGTVP